MSIGRTRGKVVGVVLVGLSMACGCGGETNTAGTQDERAGDASGRPWASARPSGAASGAAAASLPAPTAAATGIPLLPATIPSGPTHYAIATPPPSNADCPSVPKTGPLGALAHAVRRLSCEPALFFLPGDAELRAELALPAGHEASFSGPSTVTIEFPKGPAVDLASALGVKGAVAARRNAGAWGWRIWDMVLDEKTHTLDVFGPGTLNIGVRVDAAGVDDEVNSVPIEQAALRGDLRVTMPATVLPLTDDPIALAMLMSALEKLASKPSLLSSEPDVAAKELGLADDRFRVSRRSIGTGPSAVLGLDLWHARTQIAAGPLVAAMGLPGKVEHERARDSDAYVLYDGPRSEHAWRGLKVEPRFEKREGPAAEGRHGGWIIDAVTVMP